MSHIALDEGVEEEFVNITIRHDRDIETVEHIEHNGYVFGARDTAGQIQ